MGTGRVAWGKSLGFTLSCGTNHTPLLRASWAFYLTNSSDITNFLCLLLSSLGTLKICWFWPFALKTLRFWQATARHSVVCDLQRTDSLYRTTCHTNTSMAVTWDGGNWLKNWGHDIAPFSSFLSQAIFFREKQLCILPPQRSASLGSCCTARLLCSSAACLHSNLVGKYPRQLQRSWFAGCLLCSGGCAELRVSHRNMRLNCLNWALWCTVFHQGPRGNIAGEYH